jgi:aerotolerance regulator-like protein
MSFLAPGFVFASLAVAAAIVALHFIVTRQPRAGILPTARFVPDTRATAIAPARRPSDLLLMLLRVLLVLAAGAGLARPILKPSRGAEARVILVDVSRSAGDSTAMRDNVRTLYRDGDAVVVFDSSARLVAGNVADTLRALKATNSRGNLSAALIAALRAGSSLRDRADSLGLVIVSPFAREELDAATDSIRKLWFGKARLVRVGASATETAGLTSKSDSALIEWPASTRPRFAIQRAARDTVGGVSAGDAIVVSTFERQWVFPADSLRGAEVIARWVDGEAAAIEKPDGLGCLRSVAVPVSPVGDFTIRKDFIRFAAWLSRPCARITSMAPAEPGVVAKLEGKGGLAPREVFQPLNDARSDLAPWLFALALAAAIAELFVRRRTRDAKVLDEERSASRRARAA